MRPRLFCPLRGPSATRMQAPFPERFADYQESALLGRSLDVHVHRGLAIYYWEDLTDRHVKVLLIRRADA